MARQAKKRWKDLSQGERTAITIAGGVQLALHAAALIDLARRPAAQVNGRKAAWVAASFVNFFGPLAYFTVGRKR